MDPLVRMSLPWLLFIAALWVAHAFVPTEIRDRKLHKTHHKQTHPAIPSTQTTSTGSSLFETTESGNSGDAQSLREAAKKLREDAEALKAELDSTPSSSSKESGSNEVTEQPVSYTSLKSSCWTFTYRFSSDPPPKDDESSKDNSNEVQSRSFVPQKFYTGKMTLTFLEDGYTTMNDHSPTGESSVVMEKIWGWDPEVSNEDGLKYILFSATTRIPDVDPSQPGEPIRFYWQARVDSDASSSTLSLADGTITVKKDIQPPGGFLGIFDGGGILAQFRYVGNFVAKPSAIAE